MPRNILFLIVAVVLIGGGWLLLRGNGEPVPPPTGGTPPASGTPTPASPPPAAAGKTVRYTDSGYEPKELRVAAGETVTFVNESSDTVWTASNPHPSHTNYSAFDERKESNPGESYSFTFTQKGTWRYHNHLNPGHTGTIIVE